MKKRGPAPRLIRHPLERAVDDGRTGARPERLVGFGFRCWLRGLRTGEAALWQLAWREYSGALGPAAARPVLDRLSGWVLAVDCEAARRIDTHPPGCLGFCRDECLAISMVAACQHNACPAMRACAFAARRRRGRALPGLGRELRRRPRRDRSAPLRCIDLRRGGRPPDLGEPPLSQRSGRERAEGPAR